MDSIGVQVAVLLAILLLLVLLVSARGHDGRSRFVPILTWLLLTAVALWCGGLAAFVVVHAILFTLGNDAAMVVMVVSGIILAAIPFGLALVIRRGMPHVSARG